jgi:hypothetical protein
MDIPFANLYTIFLDSAAIAGAYKVSDSLALPGRDDILASFEWQRLYCCLYWTALMAHN